MIKKIALFIVSIIIIGGITWVLTQKKDVPSKPELTVFIGDAELKVETASTEQERNRGLGGRKNLKENHGMLFIFEKPGKHSFWMQGMEFPIDIIWLDSDLKVVDILKNALPESYPNYFVPEKEAFYVLETNAHWTEKNNIGIGSKAVFLWQLAEKAEQKKDLIKIYKPKPMDILNRSGFILKGEARGNWYFEASFPVKLIDLNGKTIFSSYAEAKSDWMTEDFVPFEKEFYFDSEPTSKYGLLILEKDNPSGLPEHADSLEIPVRFR